MFEIVPIHEWNQRVEPKQGTALGQKGIGWELYRAEAGRGFYGAFGVYLGYNLVVMVPEDFVRTGGHDRKPEDFPGNK